MSSKTLVLCLFGAWALAGLITLIPVWAQLDEYVFNAYDLGIFAQALHRIGWRDLNPHLTLLNTRLLNDHYQPIVLLAAPLARMVHPMKAAVLAENVFVLLSVLPLLALRRGRRIADSFLVFGIAYLLLNKGMVSAMHFPVHPTTWAALPMVALGIACAENRRGMILAALTLLFQFKEEFCFVGFTLAVAYLLKKEWRFAALLLAWSALWTGAVFWLRPLWLGPVIDHGAKILGPLRANPFGQVIKVFTSPDRLQTLFQCVIPLLPVWIWAYRAREPVNTPMIWALLPLLAIRFIGDAWDHHYMAPVTAGFLVCWLPRPSPPGKIVILSSLILLLAIDGHVRDAIEFYAHTPTLAQRERLTTLNTARDILLRDSEGACAAEGNLIPALVTRDNLYMLGGTQPDLAYRYVFVEKPPRGDPWPLTFEDIDRLIARLRRAPGRDLLIDDRHAILVHIIAD